MLRRHFCRIGLLLTLGLATRVGAADSFASVYLSEFLADNQRGLKDDEGSRFGWIELYNGGNSPVNLAGWFLTDNPTNLTKWRFPHIVLLPDKFVLVFASGKDRTNDLTHLHTNFRLTKEGGYLALVNTATNVISEFAPHYPKQSVDVSYGRLCGEPAVMGSFLRPTPGRPNASSGPGFAPEVTFSQPSGNFTQPFRLQLSTAPGAVIRYTTNGTLPNTNSLAYSAPLLITNTAHIRARAYQQGRLPGPPASEAYLELSSNVLAFNSTLPVLIMDTLGTRMPASAQDSFARLSLHEPVRGKTSLTNPPTLTARGGFHIRGSTSSGFPQSPFALQFRDEFNDEKNVSPLNLPADSDWVLYAPNAFDPVMIHNPFIYQLSRDMGRYSPRTRFVEVFLVRNAGSLKDAHYYGVYVLTEKIKIGKNRVNIDRLGADDLKPPQITGGYLLKFDRVGPGEGGFWSSGERGLVYGDPKEQIINLPQRTPQRDYIRSFMTTFNQTLYGEKWKDPAAGYRAFLDVDAAIDYHVLEVLSGNVDAMVLSAYFYKARNGKIVCGPHWDFDRALGSTDHRDANPRHWNTGPFFGGEWWPRLFSDPDFWQLWVDRWQELRQTHFSLTNLNALIDRLASEVREAQPREYQRWNLDPRGGSYQSEIDLMKDWLANRVEFIDAQLTQPPKVGGNASVVTLATSTNVPVYYTLDGSDPRLPQGKISTNAMVYTQPIQMKPRLSIVARAYDVNQRQSGGPPSTTPWSMPIRNKPVSDAR